MFFISRMAMERLLFRIVRQQTFLGISKWLFFTISLEVTTDFTLIQEYELHLLSQI
jgi:hypothetical protein